MGRAPARPDGQMSADEFIAEVIGIGRLDAFHIDVDHAMQVGDRLHERVRVWVKLTYPAGGPVEYVGVGRTMGLAMRAAREQIRMETGR